jgi:DNA polymerase III gamma/tau subunit
MSEGKLLDQISLKGEEDVVDKPSIPAMVGFIDNQITDQNLAMIGFRS